MALRLVSTPNRSPPRTLVEEKTWVPNFSSPDAFVLRQKHQTASTPCNIWTIHSLKLLQPRNVVHLVEPGEWLALCTLRFAREIAATDRRDVNQISRNVLPSHPVRYDRPTLVQDHWWNFQMTSCIAVASSTLQTLDSEQRHAHPLPVRCLELLLFTQLHLITRNCGQAQSMCPSALGAITSDKGRGHPWCDILWIRPVWN